MRLSHCPSWRHSGHPQNNLYVASPHFHNILCTLQSFHASYNLLAPWKGSYDKPMTNLDRALKSRDIPLLTKVHIVEAMVYSVVTYGCELDQKEGWAPKNWSFQLRCWRRLLRVSWTAKRSNHSIPKEINSEYLPEGLILKLQYFSHLMHRTDLLEKILMLGKIEGKRSGQQRMR